MYFHLLQTSSPLSCHGGFSGRNWIKRVVTALIRLMKRFDTYSSDWGGLGQCPPSGIWKGKTTGGHRGLLLKGEGLRHYLKGSRET